MGETIDACPKCGSQAYRLEDPDTNNIVAENNTERLSPEMEKKYPSLRDDNESLTYSVEETPKIWYLIQALAVASVIGFVVFLAYTLYTLFGNGGQVSQFSFSSPPEVEIPVSDILPFPLNTVSDYDNMPEEYQDDYVMAYGASFAMYMLARDQDNAPDWLESMSFTWDCTLPANSNMVPIYIEINNEPLNTDNIHNYPLETLGYCGEFLQEIVIEMGYLEDYILELEENPDNIDLYYQRFYGTSAWSQYAPLTLDLERTPEGVLEFYTTSDHWAQLGIPTVNKQDGLFITLLEMEYQEYHEYTDIYIAYEMLQAINHSIATLAPRDLQDEFLSWSLETGVSLLDVDSLFGQELNYLIGNTAVQCSDFGRENPVIFKIAFDPEQNPYVYLDETVHYRWAEELSLNLGPL